MSTNSNSNSNAGSKYTPWLVGLAVVLLMVSSLSFFVTTNIYDSDRFARKTTEAITSEASREAIAQEVTSELLADESYVAQKILTTPTEALVAGFLKTDLFSNVFNDFAKGLNRFLTTKDFEPVTINIGAITTTITTIADTIEPDNTLDLSKYENEEITLLDNVDLPPFKTIGQTLLIVGPIAFLALIGLGVFAYNKLPNKKDLLKHAGLVLIIAGSLLLVITFTSGGLLTIKIIDPERSIIMQEIYNSFVASFRFLQFVMVIIGGLLYSGYHYQKNDVNLSVIPKKH